MRPDSSSLHLRYDEAKKALLNVGYIIEGSLVKRMITCGKPSCRCHQDPEKRHGPYYQLTWKRGGKTVSQFISESLANRYQEWITNRKKLVKTVNVMYRISRKAIDSIVTESASQGDRRIASIVKKKLRKK